MLRKITSVTCRHPKGIFFQADIFVNCNFPSHGYGESLLRLGCLLFQQYTFHVALCLQRCCSAKSEPIGSVCMLTSQLRHKVIRIDDTMDCFCRASASDAERVPLLAIFNLLLWPTLLLVVGFVILFLTCIRMFHDIEERRKPKTSRNRLSAEVSML